MKSKNHLILGIFVLAGLFLIMGTIAILGVRSSSQRKVTMETYFAEPVHGLDKGSPVRFRGVPIGEVTEISIVSRHYETKENNYAVVRMDMFPEQLGIPEDEGVVPQTTERVKQGLRIQLQRNPVSGVAYLEAIYVTGEDLAKDDLQFEWLPEYLYIPSTRSTLEGLTTSVERIMAKLEKTDLEGVVAEARDTLKTLRQTVDQTNIPGLAQDLREMVKSARAAVQKTGTGVDEFVTSAKSVVSNLDEGVKDIRASFKTTLANADQALREIETLTQKKTLQDALGRLDDITKNADGAITELRKLLQTTDRSVTDLRREVVGRRGNLQNMLAGIRELTDNLNRMTGTLERYPSLMLFGNPPPRAIKGPRKAKAQ